MIFLWNITAPISVTVVTLTKLFGNETCVRTATTFSRIRQFMKLIQRLHANDLRRLRLGWSTCGSCVTVCMLYYSEPPSPRGVLCSAHVWIALGSSANYQMPLPSYRCTCHLNLFFSRGSARRLLNRYPCRAWVEYVWTFRSGTRWPWM